MKKIAISLIISISICVAIAIIANHYKNTPKNTPVKKIPQRIVTLAPNLTEIAFGLGLGDKIAAVSRDSDYPPAAKQKPTVGSFWQPDLESIIASRPDLVITLWFEQQKAIAESLNRLGIDTIILRIEKIEHLFDAIKKIGDATDCTKQAEELTEKIRKQIEAVRLKCASSKKPKVLWVVQTEPLRIGGRDTFLNELIEIAGGENAVGFTLQKYPQIGTEQLLSCNADVIIQSAMSSENIDEQQKAAEYFWSQKTGLPAVKNKNIFVVNADLVQRLGPRLPQGIEIIGVCLHPEILEK